MLVAAARPHRQTGPQPELRGHLGKHAPRGFFGAQHPGHRRVPVDVRRHQLGEQVGAPPVLERRVVAGAGGVGPVRDALAGQPVRQPVVRHQHGGEASQVGGLVLGEPGELGDGQRGGRGQAGRAHPVPGPVARDQGGRLRRGRGVVPQLGGPQYPAGGVEGHQAVTLGGHAHGVDGARPHARVPAGQVERGGEGAPPSRGVLLAERRVRHRVRGAAGPEQRAAVGVAELHGAGLRRAVDACDDGHGQTVPLGTSPRTAAPASKVSAGSGSGASPICPTAPDGWLCSTCSHP